MPLQEDALRRTVFVLALLWPPLLTCRQSHEPPDASGAAEAELPAAQLDRRPAVDFYDVGVRPRAIAVADLNGDGFPDVVATIYQMWVAPASRGQGIGSMLVDALIRL